MSRRSNQFFRIAAASLAVFAVYSIAQANVGGDSFVLRTARTMPFGDKIGHLLLTGAITFTTLLALSTGRWRSLRARLVVCTSIATIFLLEECSQLFLVRRNFDLADIACDLLGILLAYGAVRTLDPRLGLTPGLQPATSDIGTSAAKLTRD